MPPKAFPKASKTFVAERYGPDCPALYSVPRNSSNVLANAVQATLSQVGHEQNEDCLTINVWAKPQTGEKTKAILVSLVSSDLIWLVVDVVGSFGSMEEVSQQERLTIRHTTGKTSPKSKMSLL
jgi:hypothetical protein